MSTWAPTFNFVPENSKLHVNLKRHSNTLPLRETRSKWSKRVHNRASLRDLEQSEQITLDVHKIKGKKVCREIVHGPSFYSRRQINIAHVNYFQNLFVSVKSWHMKNKPNVLWKITPPFLMQIRMMNYCGLILMTGTETSSLKNWPDIVIRWNWYEISTLLPQNVLRSTEI